MLALVLATDKNALDFTRQLIKGIGAHIQNTPFHLNVIPEFERSDPAESVRYILENQTADGIILTHTSAQDPRVKFLMDANFPFVSHGRTEFMASHAYHDFHAERYVELAIARLANKNRHRVLLAAVDNDTTNYAITVNSFNRSIAKTELVGEVIEDPNVCRSTDNARAFGRQLATQANRCDAIVCNNELIALAMIGGLQDKGLVLGDDYDLICKQTTEILPILYPNMDTVAEDLFATGSELTKLLIARIDHQPLDTLQTLHQPIIHWRSDSQY